MTRSDLMLRSVVDSPNDDVVKGVYADALLEEGGDLNTARGQFILKQLEAARTPVDRVRAHHRACYPTATPGCDVCRLIQEQGECFHEFYARADPFDACGLRYHHVRYRVQPYLVEVTYTIHSWRVLTAWYRNGFVWRVVARRSVLLGGVCCYCSVMPRNLPYDPCALCGGRAAARTLPYILPHLTRKEPVCHLWSWNLNDDPGAVLERARREGRAVEVGG